MVTKEHEKVAQFIGEPLSLSGPTLKLTPQHWTGGNSLDVAPPGRVHDFVKEHGGHTVITKVRTNILPPNSFTDSLLAGSYRKQRLVFSM
jgi:hypothetical protein